MRIVGRHMKGQALVLVALTLGLLVVLIIGVNEVALRRRTQSRIQNSLDQAAAGAVAQINTMSLVGDAPTLSTHIAESFRFRLQSNLHRVAGMVQPDPQKLAEQAHMTLAAAGDQCHGQLVSAPALCADLTVTLTDVFGTHRVTFTTLAQATRQP
jgi:hypothetical protein